MLMYVMFVYDGNRQRRGIIMRRHNFKTGDYVRWIQNGKEHAGCIVKNNEKSVLVLLSNGSDAPVQMRVSKDKLEYLPPVTLSRQDLRSFARFELTWNELLKDAVPMENFRTKDTYEITLDDLYHALTRIQEDVEANIGFDADWFGPMQWDLEDVITYSSDKEDYRRSWFETMIPETEAQMVDLIWAWFMAREEDHLPEADGSMAFLDVSAILKDIENFKAAKKVKPWLWSEEDRKEVIRHMEDKGADILDEETKEEFRNILLGYAEEGNVRALECLGYCYYGGNNGFFPCDWVKSRDCFLKLMGMENVHDQKKCMYANTLGYIYYYGRCNHGVPEYKEALKYFSIGAAGWFYESIYKLSDMYLHGYGTPVNKLAARNLIEFIWKDNVDCIEEGKFDSKFADVALRKGNLCRDGVIKEDEYVYYTLADFAMRKRLPLGWYGDTSVYMGIQKELRRIREKRPLKKERKIIEDFPQELNRALFEHSCMITFTKSKNEITITAKRLENPREEYVTKFFVCHPDHQYCDLVDTVKETTLDLTDCWTKGGASSFIADSAARYHDRTGEWVVFTHHDEIVAGVLCKGFVFRLPSIPKGSDKVYHFAGVVFTPNGRQYDYIADGFDLKPGDKVVVHANGEDKEVTVTEVFDMAVRDLPLDIQRYKRIERKA